MPSKRKHDKRDDVMAFFIDEINQWTPKASESLSFHELIRDAHEWGEARVNAELMAMQLDGATAATRRDRLSLSGASWYACGYRMYLIPESADMPDALLDNSFRTNATLLRHPEWDRRAMATDASVIWWEKYASPLREQVLALANAEARPQAVAAAVPAAASAPARSSTSSPPAPPPPPPPPPPAPPPPPPPPPPPRAPPRAPPHPKLPKPLACLLASPAEKQPSSPREGITSTITSAFDMQRMMRVWDDGAGNGSKRTFKLLEARAHETTARLKASGLRAIYGREEPEKCEHVLKSAGLHKLGGGGYNSIWEMHKPVSERAEHLFRNIFPEHDIAERFVAGELVLRVPHSHTPWVRFDDAVGEASNMLFTALCGFGPKVALLSYARVRVDDPDADEEGVKVCRYKLFAFLERGTESVDRRYSTEVMPCASATASRSYYNALLTCVYQFSWQGFVHLDGTLRNFVDFYSAHLPATIDAWRINTIDVERKHFRRLCPQATTDWRDLFLVNLLVALTYLKISLGQRWDAELHWPAAVRALATHLIMDLGDRHTLPAILRWEGAFSLNEEVPDLAKGSYVGDTHEKAALCLALQLRYYLLKLPVDQCALRYVDKLLSGEATPSAIATGSGWYEGVYRPDLYPAHCYFRERLEVGRPRENPRRLVTLLYEFLDVPHGELRALYSNRLPPLNAHRVGNAREVLLGV